MKTLQRVGLATIVALAFSLAASAAFAVEYEDIIGLTREGVSTRTIMELIVKDGRAFEMSEEETQRLRDENVDPEVIKAMLDPSYAETWLNGGNPPSGGGASDGEGDGGGGGYSTSLDQAYGQGYSAGVATSLVFSFGYYYGPLSRYYYCDPFYYSFWNSGFYGCGYWPSYCAAYYRPYASCYGAYPYNYYNYNSYYCNTYYDPGYYAANGYNVSPGGRSVYDNGPRWRDGGLPPESGGRSRDAMAAGAGHPAAPPVVRDLQPRDAGAGTGTRSRDLVANNGMRDGRVSSGVGRTGEVGHSDGGSSGGGTTRVIRGSDGSATRSGGGSRIDRSAGDMQRGNEAGRMAREGRTPRTVGSSEIQRGEVGRSTRSWLPQRGEGTNGVRRVDGTTNRGVSRGVTRYDSPGSGRQMSVQRGRGSSYGAPQRSAPSQSRGGGNMYRGGGGASYSAPRGYAGGGSMSRGGGGGGAPRGGGGSATMSRGGGGGGGAHGGGGGGRGR